jgi:hypothetical protein
VPNSPTDRVLLPVIKDGKVTNIGDGPGPGDMSPSRLLDLARGRHHAAGRHDVPVRAQHQGRFVQYVQRSAGGTIEQFK